MAETALYGYALMECEECRYWTGLHDVMKAAAWTGKAEEAHLFPGRDGAEALDNAKQRAHMLRSDGWEIVIVVIERLPYQSRRKAGAGARGLPKGTDQ